jgi:hypothetical protein
MKQGADRALVDVITLVFQPMELNQPFGYTLWFLQDRDDFVQLHRHALNHAGQLARRLGRLVNVIHYDRSRGAVDQIDYVIQRFRHHVDVFSIERRNERLIQAGRDIMRQIVTGVLDAFNALHILLIVAIAMRKHFHQCPGGVIDV